MNPHLNAFIQVLLSVIVPFVLAYYFIYYVIKNQVKKQMESYYIDQVQKINDQFRHNLSQLYDRTGQGRWIAEQSAHVVDVSLILLSVIEDKLNRCIAGELTPGDIGQAKQMVREDTSSVENLKKTFDETVRKHLEKEPWKPDFDITYKK